METTVKISQAGNQEGLPKLTYNDVHDKDIQKIVKQLACKYSSTICKDRAYELGDIENYLWSHFFKFCDRGYVKHYVTIYNLLECNLRTLVKKKNRPAFSLDEPVEIEEDTFNKYEAHPDMIVHACVVEVEYKDFKTRLTEKERFVLEALMGEQDVEGKALKTAIAKELNTTRKGVRRILKVIKQKLEAYEMLA